MGRPMPKTGRPTVGIRGFTYKIFFKRQFVIIRFKAIKVYIKNYIIKLYILILYAEKLCQQFCKALWKIHICVQKS